MSANRLRTRSRSNQKEQAYVVVAVRLEPVRPASPRRRRRPRVVPVPQPEDELGESFERILLVLCHLDLLFRRPFIGGQGNPRVRSQVLQHVNDLFHLVVVRVLLDFGVHLHLLLVRNHLELRVCVREVDELLEVRLVLVVVFLRA